MQPCNLEVPIPNLAVGAVETSRLREAVKLDDVRNAEPLVSIHHYGIAGSCYYAQDDGLNPPYYRSFEHAKRTLLVRQGVAELLAHANELLSKNGIELYVYDAFRSIELQKELWLAIVDSVETMPCWREGDDIAAAFCANPLAFDMNDSTTWTNHITGGSVDVTLRNLATGQLLFMGGILDDLSAVSSTRFFEDPGRSAVSLSDREARRNRRTLYHALHSVGFTNFPNEWWHFDFGNQMWAAVSRAAESDFSGMAFYGPVASFPEAE